MRVFLAFGFCALLAGLLALSHAPAARIDDTPDLSLPAYSACAQDDDCALIRLPCGEVAAARLDRREALQFYYDDVMTRMRCPRIATPPPAAAVCRENACTLAVAEEETPAKEESPAGEAAQPAEAPHVP